ncbi:MAG: CotS family spore coat protein [Clostridium perfringens]|nr:CotS family spore coat protein [Clostridium perfringens]
MVKVRYSDEKYLCKYDLSMDFFERLGLDITDLWPNRNVYILDTKQGKKILKMIDYSNQRLNFICKGMDYIRNNYENILNINTLPNGEKSILWKGKTYILMNLIDGVECEVANPIDLEITSKSLGLMHKASYGLLETLSNKEIIDNLGNYYLEKVFNEDKEFLLKFKEQVAGYKYRNEFDEIFLNNVDENIEIIEKCKDLLKLTKYYSLWSNNKYIVLCHNDLAYHNIIIKDKKVNFIDFDYSKIDLRIKDLSEFITKTIKRFGFSVEMCDTIIDNYSKVNDLCEEELNIMYIYMMYPYDFTIISKEYYKKLKDWNYESYLYKLKNKLSYTKEKEETLKYFRDKYL